MRSVSVLAFFWVRSLDNGFVLVGVAIVCVGGGGASNLSTDSGSMIVPKQYSAVSCAMQESCRRSHNPCCDAQKIDLVVAWSRLDGPS